jgi:hypothetical protein
MRLFNLLIVLLMAIFIAAPLVDALACDACGDMVPVRNSQQENASQQDICPFCSGSVAAVSTLICGAPSTINHTTALPELIVLSEPSYSINKPPQN